MCGRLMSPANETQSMREIRLLHGRLPRKGGGLTGMVSINSNLHETSYLLIFFYFNFLYNILIIEKNKDLKLIAFL